MFRELWEILKEKVEPERRRRGDPFYFIPFTRYAYPSYGFVRQIRILLKCNQIQNIKAGNLITTLLMIGFRDYGDNYINTGQ